MLSEYSPVINMITESKRIEFWNFLTTEKNQARPKGITVQRLAVIKSAIISLDDLWLSVIDHSGVGNRKAAEFYRSDEEAAVRSRTDFWNGVRSIIRQNEHKKRLQNPQSDRTGKSRQAQIPRKRRRQF
jgi:hypothetical protein